MKKLQIDLELLVQSFFFEDEELCKEYLDTYNGEIINIPEGVNKVVQGTLSEEELEDWEKELVAQAYAIVADSSERYISIPKSDFSYLEGAMEEFIDEKISNEEIILKLLAAVKGINPMRAFKSVLLEYPSELEEWYEYEEAKGKEEVIQWLNKINITLF